jgi:hypothetical protein
MDAFTKYSVVTAIVSKDGEMVADTIYRDWFSKFGIPEQIHMDSSTSSWRSFSNC